MSKKLPDPHRELRDASRGERLHKVLADAGVASRRMAEQMIAELRVVVNGQTVRAMPLWVDPQRDRIEVDGRPLNRKAKKGHTYLMVNKNRGVICTNSDPEGRKRIIDLVPHAQRLFCVGRLDVESTGFVLLTDDGDLANHLTHPRYGVPKTYEVSVKGEVAPRDAERLNKMIGFADKAAKSPAPPVQVIESDRESSKLRVTLREGRNREIRLILARFHLHVRKLRRVALGPVTLKGVAPGAWRELKREEVTALRRAAGKAEGKSRTGSRRDKPRVNPGQPAL